MSSTDTAATPPTNGAAPDNRFIRSLQLENFRGIPQLDIPEFYGINLFLGENNTGKSGLLKLLYAVGKGLNVNYARYSSTFMELYKSEDILLAIKVQLMFTFNAKIRPEGRELIFANKEVMKFKTGFDNCNLEYILNRGDGLPKGEVTNTNGEKLVFSELEKLTLPTLFFLASKEILTFHKSILLLREKEHILDFDYTFYDLAKIMARMRGADRTPDEMKGLRFPFSDPKGPRVIYDDNINDFALQIGENNYPIFAAAEGIRNVSRLEQLIRNRELVPGTVLFINEPETGLHPTAIRDYMQLLIELSQRGIQVFMASHSQLVMLYLEYLAKTKKVDIGCFSLLHDSETGIRLDQSNLRERVPENGVTAAIVKLFNDTADIQ